MSIENKKRTGWAFKCLYDPDATEFVAHIYDAVDGKTNLSMGDLRYLLSVLEEKNGGN